MTWNIMERSGIVTIWNCRDSQDSPRYAVTFNGSKGAPVQPADNEEGAPSVMLAFQKLERADNLKKPDSLGID